MPRALLKPSARLLLAAFFLFFCPVLHAELEIPGDVNIPIRDLQPTGTTAGEPLVAASGREAGNISLRSLKVAQVGPSQAAAAAAVTPPPDEYGDVIPDQSSEGSDEYGDVGTEEEIPAKPQVQITDPVRPFNVVMYHLNDKLYFWAYKPVSTGYKYVVPGPIRSLFSSFYENLKAPVRIVNNLLQGRVGYAGEELATFLINSTVGVGGLRNCAEECFGLKRRDADFGQTLGKWSLGPGFYLVLPFLGPSSVRDGFGLLVDCTLRPQTYVGTEFFNYENVGLFAHERINSTSFHLGEYETLKKASIDPYVAMRDIYIQYRKNLIEKR